MPEDSDVRSDKPGKCPKCSMTLIPIMEAPPATRSEIDMTMPAANH
jgi:hypothetical protein